MVVRLLQPIACAARSQLLLQHDSIWLAFPPLCLVEVQRSTKQTANLFAKLCMLKFVCFRLRGQSNALAGRNRRGRERFGDSRGKKERWQRLHTLQQIL